METDTPTLGQLISDRREEAGLTQEGLAALADVSKSTISAWEHGTRKPDSPKSFGRLATALKIEQGTPEYAALRAAWKARSARVTQRPVPSGEDVVAPQETQADVDVPFEAQVPPRAGRRIPRAWNAVTGKMGTPTGQAILGLAVVLAVLLAATFGSIAIGRALTFPHLKPGFIKSVAVATTCESPRCAVYRAQLSQIYQRNASLRQTYGIKDLDTHDHGQRCAITPASVSASILACSGCRVFSDGLNHEYSFMVFKINLRDARSGRTETQVRWLRLDQYANGATATSSGRGAIPAWTHPSRC